MPVKIHAIRAGDTIREAGKIIGVPEDSQVNVNIVAFEIDGILEPQELAQVEEQTKYLANQLDLTKPVIITGRGPTWLYSLLTHQLHLAPAVAIWDPRSRTGVIVAASADELLGKGVTLDGEIKPIDMPGASTNPDDITVAHGQVNDKYIIHIEPKTRMLHPEVVLKKYTEELRDVYPGTITVIEGPQPVWSVAALTAMLQHRAPAIAVYDPKQRGAVVTVSHTKSYSVGSVLPVSREEIEAVAAGEKRERRVSVEA